MVDPRMCVLWDRAIMCLYVTQHRQGLPSLWGLSFVLAASNTVVGASSDTANAQGEDTWLALGFYKKFGVYASIN